MNYNDNSVILLGVIISNVVALLMLWLSIKRPAVARLLFILLFLWAGITNILTVTRKPQVYLDYADFAVIPFYRQFILGFFNRHITVLVITIGLCQLLISIGLSLRGILYGMACAGGIVFLLSIVPLGWGSGFPAPLWWALALYFLFRKRESTFIWSAWQKRIKTNVATDKSNR